VLLYQKKKNDVRSTGILDRYYCCGTYAQVIRVECKDAERVKERKLREEDSLLASRCGDASNVTSPEYRPFLALYLM
jgi:hypothetical protein